MKLNLDWKHLVPALLAAATVGLNEYASETGHPLIVHGISAALVVTMLTALFTQSPATPKDPS